MSMRSVAFVMANLTALLGVALLLPLTFAVVMNSGNPHEAHEVLAFVLTSGLCLGFGIWGRRAFREHAEAIRLREGFVVVGLAWVWMSLIGMLPYLFTGTTHSVADAFFETMSGFTTTGASIFPKVEVLPHGVQLWRCMTQWLGGMGIVVLSVALLPMLGVGGYRLLKAETPGGVAYEREMPRMADAAKNLWFLYGGISLVLFLLFWILGMSFYDALCHAFTTMSTGGFSTHTESMAYFDSPAIQWVTIVFMLIAGTNFSLHALALKGRFAYAANLEFLTYLGIFFVLVCTGILTVNGSGERLIRDVAFQVASVSTTTGFATADFDVWPPLMKVLLFTMMFMGGCMGSTSGGSKVGRFLVNIKFIFRELHRMLYPHGLRPLRLGERVLDDSIAMNIIAFALIFMGAFFVGAMVMAFAGYDFATSLSASISALGNIGPGLGRVGPSQNWQHLPDYCKWVMSFLMLIGRLEIFSIMILFTRWLWRP